MQDRGRWTRACARAFGARVTRIGLVAAACGGTTLGLASDQPSRVKVASVLVPQDSRLLRMEFNRLQPDARFVPYEGQKTVELAPDAVLVMFVEAPPRARQDLRSALALTLYEKRRIFVFMENLKAALRMEASDPRFRIALGRVLAHEIEHIKRQTDQHDEEGFFKACVNRQDLLALSAGSP